MKSVRIRSYAARSTVEQKWLALVEVTGNGPLERLASRERFDTEADAGDAAAAAADSILRSITARQPVVRALTLHRGGRP